MDVSIIEITGYLMAGILAGGINTLAGGGGIFSLSLLLFFGVPADIANGTNRLGILVQNLTGTITFYRSGLLDIKSSLPLVVVATVGAVIGAWLATVIQVDFLERIVGGVMLVMLVIMLTRTKSKPLPASIKPPKPSIGLIIVMGVIGFYGGFVQAGAGLIIIIALSRLAKLSLIRSNAVKMAIIFCYSVPAFAIFIWKDQVNWVLAILLAVGQVIGTGIAGKFASNSKKANQWVQRLLFLMISLTVLKTFGILELGAHYLQNWWG
mgnify:CR=1 FL=1